MLADSKEVLCNVLKRRYEELCMSYRRHRYLCQKNQADVADETLKALENYARAEGFTFCDEEEEGLVDEYPEEEKYAFPEWVTPHMKKNFFEMWRVGRSFKDYEVSRNVYLGRIPENGARVRLPNFEGRVVEGEFYYKWNNIGWLYDGQDCHHVSF